MKDFFKDQFFKALEKNTIFSRSDVQGNLIFVSDKLCQISGYSKKELIGKKHSIFKHPDVEECYIEELLKKLSCKKPYQVIFKNIDKLGKTFYLETLLIPILDKNNELIEIVAFSHDVSNSFKLNEELALNHARLRELSINLENTVKNHQQEFIQLGKKFEKKVQIALEKNEKDIKIVYEEILKSSLEQMISDIAHQWRQPLNELGIAMFQMKQNLKDEKGFAEIYSQSKDMIKNMSETIDVFRTLFNKGVEQCVFIKETLNKALEIAFETIEKNHVNINIVSKSDYEVLAYENGLIRVFLNLILNSIEAFKNKKRKIITITFSKFGKNYLKITIKDNAGGIDKENLDKIFQPYFTTKHPSQGIGVGLYISRQIIESFQGKIKVKNGKDGACFEVFLKLKESKVEMSQECKELIILVVEDEIKTRESLINVLSERFSKVIGAQNGDEGLKKFKKFKPDLVITDIAMPVMDGLDMAREIKEISDDVPIVVLSAYSEKERLLRSIDIGIDKYLIKPVDIEELFKVLDCLVGEKIEANMLVKISEEYQFNKTKRTLIHNGKEIVLTKKELAFISFLLKQPGVLVLHEDIKKNVWIGEHVSDTAVRTFIKRVRDKVGEDFIKNVPSLGYKININK